MDIRALSRADAAAVAAALTLVAASFLTFYSVEACQDRAGVVCSATAWKDTMLPVLLTLHAVGAVAGALVLVSVYAPGRVSLLGLEVSQWATGCAFFSAWSAIGPLFGGGEEAGLDVGAVLSTGSAVALAAAVGARGRVPALDLPLMAATAADPRPKSPRPVPAPHNPYATGSDPVRPPAPSAPVAWPSDQTHAFAPFWFSVPESRVLLAEHTADGTPQAELYPGVWYLAAGQVGAALIVETPDQRRGRLEAVSGIRRWGG